LIPHSLLYFLILQVREILNEGNTEIQKDNSQSLYEVVQDDQLKETRLVS